MMYTVKRGRKPAVQLESQETISKNSFLCFMDIVTCDRGVNGKNTVYSGKRECDRLLSQPFFSVQLYEQLWFN